MTVLRARWLWTGHGLIKDGAVAIGMDGRLTAVGAAAEVCGGQQDHSHEDLGDALLMPGLVNSHSHAFQRAFRGHTQWLQAEKDGKKGDFWTWREAMYRTANQLDAAQIEAVSRRCFIEMIEAGITHVGEFHYLHHDRHGQPYADPDELAKRVIRAARQVGLRITLLRGIYATGGVGQALQPAQRRFATASPDAALASAARLAANDDPLVTIGLAPHSVRAVPMDWLPEFAGFSGPIHAHVAEQPVEVAACKAAWGRGPLQVFADAGLISPRFTAVHLTWPEAGDRALLTDGGSRICVCPSTELDLGDGLLPVAMREDVALCLGTDSQARIDLFAEARTLEWHARALVGRRNVLSPPGQRHGLAARLLRAATLAGTAALLPPSAAAGTHDNFKPAKLGLQRGQPADLCAIDLDRPAAEGVPPLEAAVFVATPEWVRDVWVAGRRVVRSGKAEARRS